MRKELLVAALGFVIGAAALAVGQEDDGDLEARLERLQEEIDRARLAVPAGQEILVRDFGQELRLYPVFDLTSGAPHYRPPEHAFDMGDSGSVAREEVPEDEMRLPVGTIEEVVELVRASVRPETWEGSAWIAATGQTLLVGQGRAVHAEIARFLDGTLREAAHRCVTVEAQAVDMTRELYRSLGAGPTTALSDEQAQALAAALGDGSATRVFDVRATGFAGQHFVAWHGRQLAVVARAAAIVGKGVSDHDPEIATLRVGGYLAVRPSAGDDPGRITLDVDVRLDALDTLETIPTGTGLDVDTPRLHTCRALTSLTIPNRTWAIVGGGTPRGEEIRVLLVRATYLPRAKGGVK